MTALPHSAYINQADVTKCAQQGGYLLRGDFEAFIAKRWKEGGPSILALCFAVDPFWNELRYREDVLEMDFDGKTIEDLLVEAFIYTFARTKSSRYHTSNGLSTETFIQFWQGLVECFHTTCNPAILSISEWLHPRLWFTSFEDEYMGGCPGSKEAGERNFKTWKRAMTPTRNRFSDTKCGK